MARGGRRAGAGRPPGAVSAAKRELAELAKEHVEAALATLAEIAERGESEPARVSAATAILDRAFGKPRQAVEHSGAQGGPIETREVSNRDVAKVLLAALTKAEEGADC